ncbi:MAG TPA: protein kinase, partial [Isosphaeraceae bacterium]|nr:protein kinase [Isosphaeraceae bacterium]
WLNRHPDLGAELAEFLADQTRLHNLIDPLRVAPEPIAQAQATGPAAARSGETSSPAAAGAGATGEPQAAGDEAPRTSIDDETTGGESVTLTDPDQTLSLLGAALRAAESSPPPGGPQVSQGDSTAPHHNGQSEPLAKGTQVRYFGDYELEKMLGIGGMGIVYKARQRSLDRLVAVKMIKAARFASPDDLRRFQNEAESAARLDHPNIVPIFEVGQYEDEHYFSMKLVAGDSLDKKREQFAADPRRAAALMALIAGAIHHAHQRGILHRDLKPANILVDADGHPHVTDFGLAKRVEGDSELTNSGAILGTPAYMAPEQTSARKGAVTTATDVHGLGAIFYALLTGRAPFLGPTLVETLDHVRERAPAPPRTLNPRVPRDLEIICLKCLEKDPRRRYAGADAVGEDLNHWLAGEPIVARPVGKAARLWMWCRRNPVIAGALGLAASALVAVAVLSLLYARQQYRAAVRIGEERAEALRQKAIAIEERDRAIAQRRLARAVVHETYGEVAEKWLPNEPIMASIRQKFLERALRFLRLLLAENDPDPRERDDTARARFLFAVIHIRLGHPDRAVPELREATKLFERLVADFPSVRSHRLRQLHAQITLGQALAAMKKAGEAEQIYRATLIHCERSTSTAPLDPEFRQLLATCCFELANLLRASEQRLSEAEQLYGRALDLQERLVQEFPDNPTYRREAAKSRVNLGLVYEALGRFDDAERAFGQAFEALQRLSAEFAIEPDDRFDLAKASTNLGLALYHANRLAEAETAIRRAIDLADRLAADFPAIPGYREVLGKCYHTLGLIQADRKQPGEAEQSLRKSLAIREKLERDHPSVPDYRIQVSSCLIDLGVFLATAGRPAEAEAPLRLAIAKSEKLAADFPGMPGYQDDVGLAQHNLAELVNMLGKPSEALKLVDDAIHNHGDAVRRDTKNAEYPEHLRADYELKAEILVLLGEYDKAVEAATKAIEVPPEQSQSYYHIAALWARDLPRIAKDPKLSDTRRQERARSYADRAMKLLQQAVKKGFKDVKTLKDSSDFDALRGREDFKMLIHELEAKP